MASVVLAGLMVVAANGAKGAEKMATAGFYVAVSGKDGNPGTVAAPVATPARALEALCLSGADWRIHDDADGKGDQRGMPLADPAAADWIPATVPGNIQADLEAAHQLKPLWYGAGDPRMDDVPKKDWWYRKDFDVPASFAGQRLTLVFDGVDHECGVWVNGKRIGRNAGMFRRFWFDVTQAVEPGRRNQLAVRIARMPESLAAAIAHANDHAGANPLECNVLKCTAAFLEELKELKSPTNSGWDWGVPMYTLGIWKDVRLEAAGPARIDWVRVETPVSDNYQKAKVKVGLEVDSQIEGPARAMFRVRRFDAGTNGKLETCPPMSVDTVLKKGTNLIRADLTLDQPALWWPNGQGEQPLYEVEAALTIPDEGGTLGTRLADRRVTRFGVREIRWEQCPGAPADFINPFKLVVNGRPVRQMGSNLIPPDLLFGRIDQRGLRLLELAHRADINCLRVWGGGVIYSDAMYDRADELGIMLLSEFPLANAVPEPDPVFLANFEFTITNILKQTRNHPCIVEWTGGNEMPWWPWPFPFPETGTRHPALQTMERLVRELDGRIFRSTESAQGSGAHGSYTYVYHTEPAPYLSWLGAGNQNLYRRYDTSCEMRLSEFGCNSPANLEVWHRDIPPESQWPLTNYHDPVLVRKNVFHGAALPQNWLHKEITERVFGPAEDLEQIVRGGQFLAAEGLRYAMDALRRKGTALGGGFMSWDYNEPWPNGAGSYLIDYDGRPLMNYDFVKQALAPVVLSLKYNSLLYDSAAGVKAELWIASDAPQPAAGLKWRWLARDRRGLVIAQDGGETSIDPQEARRLATLDFKPPAKTALGPVFVEMQLHDGAGRLLAERIHVFGAAAAVNDSLAGLLRNRTPDKDDDAEQADPVELPNGPANLAFVGNGARPATATSARPEAIHQVHRVVARTAIEATTKPLRAEGDTEVLELTLENTGRMTALFCEPHPLIEYRTDLFIENNHCFIPPGEKRTVTIRAAAKPRGGLGLAQTGWRISTWNADDLTIEPSSDVLLAVGRRDAMCREFRGYGNPDGLAEVRSIELSGRRPDPSSLPFIFRPDNLIRLAFPCNPPQAGRPARLRIHTADQSAEVESQVSVSINGMSFQRPLPRGLGIQRQTPAHLAFPAIAEFQVPKDVLKTGTNVLEVRLTNGGWFTWDALDLVADDN
jgi:beta-mannosidase